MIMYLQEWEYRTHIHQMDHIIHNDEMTTNYHMIHTDGMTINYDMIHIGEMTINYHMIHTDEMRLIQSSLTIH